MIKISTGLATKLISDSSLLNIFNVASNTRIKVYTGLEPESANDQGGSYVWTIQKDGSDALDFVYKLVDNVAYLSKPDASKWKGSTSPTYGQPLSYFRIITESDNDNASTFLPRIQGTVSSDPTTNPDFLITATELTYGSRTLGKFDIILS